jgi:15-cis-phytoene synthase
VNPRGDGRADLPESVAISYCQQVTREQARNFWYGIRLLPPAKRRALAAVYALARRIDDIGDGCLSSREKQVALDEVERSLSALDDPGDDLVLAALREVAGAFPLPIDSFRDLLDGVRMDVAGGRYDCFDELVVYCRRVAGSVGRLSLAVFGAQNGHSTDELFTVADDLGVALQLTNILRDVREDLAVGRVYLPAEDLGRFAVDAQELGGSTSPRVASLIRFEAERAGEWFERGLTLLAHLDRRSAGCTGAMAGIYLRLLRRIAADPLQVTRRRLSLPAWEKAWVAGRAVVGAKL